MIHYCPNCGGQLDDLAGRAGVRRLPDDTGHIARVAFGEAGALGPLYQEFRKPSRPPNVAADVLTPFLQAAVSGLAAAAVTAAAVPVLNISWAAVPTATGLAFAGAWLFLLRAGRDSLYEVERLERAAEPPPTAELAEPPAPSTRLSVSLEGGRIQHERDLPMPPDDLLRLARAISGGGHTFSERELTGAGLVTGRRQFEELRSQLMAMGWLRWKSSADRRQGVEVTAPGRAGLAALAGGRMTVEDLAGRSA